MFIVGLKLPFLSFFSYLFYVELILIFSSFFHIVLTKVAIYLLGVSFYSVSKSSNDVLFEVVQNIILFSSFLLNSGGWDILIIVILLK